MYFLVALCLCLGLVSGQEPPSCGYGCMNRADCVSLGDDYDNYCACQPDYTGRFCEMYVPQCGGEQVCSNNGDCLDIGDGEMRCNCNNGYTGYTCETYMSECGGEADCSYKGDCIDIGMGESRCNCYDGYTGHNCDTFIPPCNSCLINTTCDSMPCKCLGSDCEDPIQDMDTTCYECGGGDYSDCQYNPWSSPTNEMCVGGCMSQSYRSEEGMWFERGCATVACWNGCKEEDGMEHCSSCCYDDYCNTHDPIGPMPAGGSLLGVSVVGASMACVLAIIFA